MKHNVQSLFLCFCIVIFSCNVTTRQYRPPGERGKWTQIEIILHDSTLTVKPVKARIYTPQSFTQNGITRTLIALHDYNGRSYDWGSHTGIVRYAEQYSIVLVCPEMDNTIYETRYYPETARKWNTVPGGKWVAEVMIPYLRDTYGLALERSKTAIAGIGTGARGALLIAASYPKLFCTAAGLSGYYDTAVLSSHSLLRIIYGSHEQFPERWKNDDNIIAMAHNFRDINVFLAHGGKDNDIPVEQSRIMGLRLRLLQKRNEGKYIFEYVENPYRYHDWRFWSSVTGDMMHFIDTHLAK